jgi:DNA-binding NtrC family response regulator
MQCVSSATLPPLPVLLVGDPDGAVGATLAAARCQVRRLTAAAWMDLSRPDAGVPVFTVEQLEEKTWPFLRVRLAESGRFFVVGSARLESAACVRALRDGAYEVFEAGDDPTRIRAAIHSTAAAEALWRRLFESTSSLGTDPEPLLGRSEAMRRLRDQVRRTAPTRATVLVLGESGVGKERVAEALHAQSGRKKFVAINCAAIPRDLLEAELFGATRGAFTGATEERPGLVEQAHGGTLFLDEVGEMDRALQPKLLRFLETRRARRVGGRSDYAVDARIIAATNADLRAGRGFREDLYYRLAEIVLEVPPLRERPEDVPELCRRFLVDAGERHGKPVSSIEPALIEKMMRWSWPGNVRELRNAVERMVVLRSGPVLGAGAWEPPAPALQPGITAAAPDSVATAGPLSRRQKRELAFQLMDRNSDDYAWVAAQLSIHPTTLYRWRKQAGRV